jgi:hypothetical protein
MPVAKHVLEGDPLEPGGDGDPEEDPADGVSGPPGRQEAPDDRVPDRQDHLDWVGLIEGMDGRPVQKEEGRRAGADEEAEHSEGPSQAAQCVWACFVFQRPTIDASVHFNHPETDSLPGAPNAEGIPASDCRQCCHQRG